MKKNKKQKEFNPGPINELVLKLNKSSLIVIISLYIALLVLIIFLLSPHNKVILIVPDYEHNLYNDDVNAQVTLVGAYSYTEATGRFNVNYNVIARYHAKLNGADTAPKIKSNRFNLSAYLNTNKMHYFTEYSDRDLPATHNYVSISGLAGTQHPEQFFIKLDYVDSAGNQKTYSQKENVLFELKKRNLFTHENKITETLEDTVKTEVRLAFSVTQDSSDDIFAARIEISDREKQYHIDMQSWIVAEDGTAYPFIGVYSFADETGNFSQSSRRFPLGMKGKYIYAQLHYYEVGKEVQTIRYQVLIDDLPDNTAQEPVYSDVIKTPNIIDWKQIVIFAIAITAGMVVAGGVYYYNKKKKTTAN